MNPEIREAIMVLQYRGKTLDDRYGRRIGDEGLLDAIDGVSIDPGGTKISVNLRKQESQGPPSSGCDQIVTQTLSRIIDG